VIIYERYRDTETSEEVLVGPPAGG